MSSDLPPRGPNPEEKLPMPPTTYGPYSTIIPTSVSSSSSPPPLAHPQPVQPGSYQQSQYQGFALPFPEPSATPIQTGSGSRGDNDELRHHHSSSATPSLPPPPPYEPSSSFPSSSTPGEAGGMGIGIGLGIGEMQRQAQGQGGQAIPLQSGPFAHQQQQQSPSLSGTGSTSLPNPAGVATSSHPGYSTNNIPPQTQTQQTTSQTASPATSAMRFAAAHPSTSPQPPHQSPPGAMPGMGSNGAPHDPKERKRRRRKLCIIICAAVLFFTIALVVGIAVGVIKNRLNDKPPPHFDGDGDGDYGGGGGGSSSGGGSEGRRSLSRVSVGREGLVGRRGVSLDDNDVISTGEGDGEREEEDLMAVVEKAVFQAGPRMRPPI